MSQSSQIKLEDVEEYELTYSTVRGLIESDLSANKILGKVKDKNKKFSDFLKETIDFIKKTTRYRFYKAVVNLSNNSILKQILKESMPKNENDFEVYLTRRLIKENSNLEAVVLNSVKGIEKNRVREIFDLKEDKKLTTVEKSKERREMFKEMLEKNIIETKLPKERLLQFVEEYSNYVNDWRNQVSHANSLAASRESNFDIAQAIINSVNLIDEKF